ncbi:hypothetical protein G6F50_017182 [Rhizopus delemar]|uniref:Uncharacterized protein n=1 Tax=Rhizopus delemar TaxID=936053 RepID=A0A9P6XRC4_9FUNG|nr:hypothetical protein G6F50_017182 [Rhizopus delemar]
MDERVVEQPQRPVLQIAFEIDQDVTAGDQVDLREHAVGRQTVVGKDHVFAQPLVEHHPPVPGGVVVGQRAAAAGAGMVRAEGGPAVQVEDALLRRAQRVRIDVGGIDQRALKQALFGQQDGALERRRY